MKQRFFKTDIGLAKRYGLAEASLVGLLANFSRVVKKDERGFFAVETAWIAENLGLPKRTTIRVIQSAASHHLIQYRPGKNQNVKPKFKLF